ncbi:hypothetical protein NSK_001457 [Nannochloropsis salina CCMP1776]|uniref:Uncharacterized protein n=1 Tax=Nannochloropsis salina CCMP1776 TaxID=1027361 RepID=A0A4D9DAS1_9STRA|nr:hypothetical protein NSK_001457 [Nannochloropsis salina CCMP1776]|eukprot:TFJ87123.1 hypothetical protein NSK_001457 [Nannochloropsis salina CCMP1776]
MHAQPPTGVVSLPDGRLQDCGLLHLLPWRQQRRRGHIWRADHRQQKVVDVMISHCGPGKPNIHVVEYPRMAASYSIEHEQEAADTAAAAVGADADAGVAAADRINHKILFHHGDVTETRRLNPVTHVHMFEVHSLHQFCMGFGKVDVRERVQRAGLVGGRGVVSVDPSEEEEKDEDGNEAAGEEDDEGMEEEDDDAEGMEEEEDREEMGLAKHPAAAVHQQRHNISLLPTSTTSLAAAAVLTVFPFVYPVLRHFTTSTI